MSKVAFAGASPDLDWWQKSIIYQIYPRSFQDSNGDGIGDLKGIFSRLDHFEFIGVEIIWLSPIYKSPMKDFGYDPSDHCDIDPMFGTLEDFDELIQEVHKRGMKLILDIVPNHTSDLHPWFKESRKSKDNQYSDYYIWHDGKVLKDGTRGPPNNWLGNFHGSAWTWDEDRQQYYFHQYLKEQPDLNFRNPKVKKDIENIFAFWLDKGVDGFRIDTVASLVETEDMTLDEPRSFNQKSLPNEYKYLNHIHTRHQHETYEIVLEWRKYFDEYERKTGRNRIYMVVEMYDETLKYSMKYYHYGADGPFNFNLVFINENTDGLKIYDMVDGWLSQMPKGKWPNWVLGNHDVKRVTGRKGPGFTDVLNMLLLLLPGTPTTYQGEELGMLNVSLSYEDTQDPFGLNAGKERYDMFSRDPCRAPMQWTGDKNAGFTTANKPWLPIHQDFHERNAKDQKYEPSGQSHLLFYKALAHLRREPSFLYGNMTYAIVDTNIFSFTRYESKSDMYLVAINFGKEKSCKDYSSSIIKGSSKVVLTTSNFSKAPPKQGSLIDITAVTLEPAQGIIVRIEKEIHNKL